MQEGEDFSTGPFEDEETRALYESLPDIRGVVPALLLGTTEAQLTGEEEGAEQAMETSVENGAPNASAAENTAGNQYLHPSKYSGFAIGSRQHKQVSDVTPKSMRLHACSCDLCRRNFPSSLSWTLHTCSCRPVPHVAVNLHFWVRLNEPLAIAGVYMKQIE